MKVFQITLFILILGLIYSRSSVAFHPIALSHLKTEREMKYFSLNEAYGGPAIGPCQAGGSQGAIGPGQVGNSQAVDGRYPRMTRTITDIVIAQFIPLSFHLPTPQI